jgi:hypothetical protein
LIGPEPLKENIVKILDVYEDGIVRWFSSPPLDVVPLYHVSHSDVYLRHLKKTKVVESAVKNVEKVGGNVEKKEKMRVKVNNTECLENAVLAWADALKNDSGMLLNKQ